MSHSLGEIEALTKRAARGAGYAWGLAEEVGFATRWLSGVGFPGADIALKLVHAFDRGETCPPSQHNGVLGAESAALCPIQTGAFLADRGITQELEIHALIEPLLILPFVGLATRQTNKPIQVSWENYQAVIFNTNLKMSGTGQNMSRAQKVLISPAQNKPQPVPTHNRCQVSPECLEGLSAFAHRTYAPATEESRNRGAGAGTTDND